MAGAFLQDIAVQKTIYANGSAEVLIPAGQKIAIATYGNEYATISFKRGNNLEFIQRLDNDQVVLGAYADNRTVVISASSDAVFYSVAESPFITDGRSAQFSADGKSLVGVDGSNVSIAQMLRRLAGEALTNNIRTRGVMDTPPSVVDGGSSLPAGQSNPFLRSTYPSMFRESGGTHNVTGKYQSATIWTTGGNLGTNDGKQTNFARTRFIADANKVTFRLTGTASAYRFIVDGQYVSLSGTVPSVPSGNVYLTLDFTSAGGRATREIAVEHTAGCGFVGVYVGPTEIVTQAPACPLNSVVLGDSYCFGSSATLLGDGIFAVMADYLGLGNHMNSGSGGTGWATGGSAYNFLQRIQNGDLALNNSSPDVVFLQGSINDKNSAAADVTANCLAGLRAVRALYPSAPIVVFGVWPASGGTGGTLSIADNEAAVKAAFDAFADGNSLWIPVNGNTPAWLVGTGFVGATTGTGDADVNMADVSHLNTVGTLKKGKMLAYAIYAALSRQGLIS